MILLDGKAVSASVKEKVKKEAAALRDQFGRPPGLCVILAGEDQASQIYVRNKQKACADVGIASETVLLPESVAQNELLKVIRELNGREDMDGILLQLPLPAHLDAQLCLALISPDKDVDGFNPINMGRLALGLPGFRPCTPAGVMTMLEHYGLSVAGKKSVVVGRSNIVGRPLSIMLSAVGKNGDSTVTLCHSKTPDLAEECRRADFVFAAIGKPRFITAEMVREGAVVVDIGINRTEKGLAGDVDFEALKDHVSAMTPVPGGVGPMTIAQLLQNTVMAMRLAVNRPTAH